MALGPTTYKTTNIITSIGSNLTDYEGCGVVLVQANEVDLATTPAAVPYGIIVTGTDSLTPGTYPSAIGDASLELVDQLGCAVQVQIGTNFAVAANELLYVDGTIGNGSFIGSANYTPSAGDWVWGIALTDADAGEQCLMRFQPMFVWV